MHAVLSGDALSSVAAKARQLEFEAGALTAGWHAREVKNNRQAAPSAALRHIQRTVAEALEGNALFRAAAVPGRVAPPLVAVSGPGEGYGAHVDDAIMGSPPLRSDLSLTLFLSDPDGYEGGELIIETRAGEDAIKLSAGAAVLYPSTTRHRVEPVRAGERLVAVTWVQSLVRDAAAREVLLDVDEARRAVFAEQGKSGLFDSLSRAHSNLLRIWAEI